MGLGIEEQPPKVKLLILARIRSKSMDFRWEDFNGKMHAIEVNGKNDSQSSNDLRTRTLNSIYSFHAPFSHCFYYYLNDLCRCLLLYVALLLFCSVRVVVLCLEFIHFHYVDVVFLCVCACTSKQIILCKTLFVTLVLTITHKYSWKMCTRTKHREHEMNKEAHNTQTHTHTLIRYSNS